MLNPGTAVCWQATRCRSCLRGRIVAHVKPGTSPAQVAPELAGLKSTQVKFGDPSRPRMQAHYLICREERNERGIDQAIYYLPPARSVEPVCGKGGRP